MAKWGTVPGNAAWQDGDEPPVPKGSWRLGTERCPRGDPEPSGCCSWPTCQRGGEEQPEGRRRGAFLGNAEAWGVESWLGRLCAQQHKKIEKGRGCVGYFLSSKKKKKSQPQTQPRNTFKAPGLPKERGGRLRHRQPATEHRLVRTEPHLQGNRSRAQQREQAAQPHPRRACVPFPCLHGCCHSTPGWLWALEGPGDSDTGQCHCCHRGPAPWHRQVGLQCAGAEGDSRS